MLVIGLISGTSADGVDAALVRLPAPDSPGRRWSAGALRAKTVAWLTRPYPGPLRRAVLRVAAGEPTTAGEICRLSFAIGEEFAAAALAVCDAAGASLDDVALIGSHGQTVWHEPATRDPAGYAGGSTLQLGQPQVIAERTGITTVADFRPRDVAAGGQGAPLVPMFDLLVLGHGDQGRILLNLGGIANVTAVPAGATPGDPLLGFDTGPGNVLLDAVAGRLSGGAQTVDRDGALAGRGDPSQSLLDRLLAEPYYAMPPPKSTGRELFDGPYVERCHAWGRDLALGPAELMATLVELTAATIAGAIQRFVLPAASYELVLAAGGGAHNPILMRALARRLRPLGLALATTAELGVPVDAKEAVAFAVLAWLTAAGRPGNLAAATGARSPVVLGCVVPGSGAPAAGGPA